jgi:hypothetical protein
MTKHKKLLDINIQIRVRKILVNNIQLNKENLFGFNNVSNICYKLLK